MADLERFGVDYGEPRAVFLELVGQDDGLACQVPSCANLPLRQTGHLLKAIRVLLPFVMVTGHGVVMYATGVADCGASSPSSLTTRVTKFRLTSPTEPVTSQQPSDGNVMVALKNSSYPISPTSRGPRGYAGASSLRPSMIRAPWTSPTTETSLTSRRSTVSVPALQG